MADMMQGALSQVMPQEQPPREMPNVPQAQGSSGMQGLLGMITSRMRPPPSPEQYQQDLGNYISAIRGPENSMDALGAVAEGLLRPSRTASEMWGNAGESLANRMALERDNEYKRNLLAAKAKYEDTVGASKEGMGVLPGILGLARSAMVHGTDVAKLVIPSYRDTVKQLIEQGDENAAENAKQVVADNLGIDVKEVMRALAGSATPGFPAAATPGAQTSQASVAPGIQIATNKGADPAETKRLMTKRMQELAASGDYAGALELQRALASGVSPQPTSPKLSGQAKAGFEVGVEGQKTTAKETSKDLTDYEKSLVEKSDNALSMNRNLDKIVKAASDANFGAGANAKTEVLKWADTLGVTLSPEEKAAMNANQIIGKVALQLATIGAKQISSRPTQLEFEKLLTEGVPATGMTKEAFLQVVNMFKEAADKEQGQLREFMKWKHTVPGAKSIGDFSQYWQVKQNSPNPDAISPDKILKIMNKTGLSWQQAIDKISKGPQ